MSRTFSIAAALTLVTAGLVGVTSAPAQASCAHGWSNKDSTSGSAAWSDAKLRTGPHSSCALVYWVPGGTTLRYHCYTTNAAGNTWTHARYAGTDEQGWIWDGHLSDGGSTKRC
jgi:hypothetical protein